MPPNVTQSFKLPRVDLKIVGLQLCSDYLSLSIVLL